MAPTLRLRALALRAALFASPGRALTFNDLHGRAAVLAEPFMTTDLVAAPRWTTSSFPADADTLPMEQSALGEHLAHCQRLTGRLFALHCAADAIHRFVAPRFVTTLTVATLLIGIGLALG